MVNIKKFEQASENKYDIEYGGHIFILARYKDGWDNFKFSTPFKNNEFVPCMISGGSNKWNKHDFFIINFTGSWNIDDFEILENSNKGFEEMIKMYSNTKKYNL